MYLFNYFTFDSDLEIDTDIPNDVMFVVESYIQSRVERFISGMDIEYDKLLIEKNSFTIDKNIEYIYGDYDWMISRMKDYVLEMIHYFDSKFLASHFRLPVEVIEAIKGSPEKSANIAFITLLDKYDNLQSIIDDCITIDGPGHFLGSYDGKYTVFEDYYFFEI